MPDVADFRLIRDGGFTLTTAGAGDIDRDFDFNLGTAVRHDQRGVIQAKYSGNAFPIPITVQVIINGQVQKTLAIAGNNAGMIHEIVNANVTQNNGNNIEFRIVSGTGSITISDVVLWFQHRI